MKESTTSANSIILIFATLMAALLGFFAASILNLFELPAVADDPLVVEDTITSPSQPLR
jgi:hypothetical protein